MKRLFGAAVLAVVVSGAAFGPVASARAASSDTTPIVIHYSYHKHYGSKFEAVKSKSAYWRGVEQKKGVDVAYTEWMQKDHPAEFAAVCIKDAHKIAKGLSHTGHKSEFGAALSKRADLRAEVQSKGYDVAFMNWLRTTKPTVYKEEMGKVEK